MGGGNGKIRGRVHGPSPSKITPQAWGGDSERMRTSERQGRSRLTRACALPIGLRPCGDGNPGRGSEGRESVPQRSAQPIPVRSQCRGRWVMILQTLEDEINTHRVPASSRLWERIRTSEWQWRSRLTRAGALPLGLRSCGDGNPGRGNEGRESVEAGRRRRWACAVSAAADG